MKAPQKPSYLESLKLGRKTLEYTIKVCSEQLVAADAQLAQLGPNEREPGLEGARLSLCRTIVRARKEIGLFERDEHRWKRKLVAAYHALDPVSKAAVLGHRPRRMTMNLSPGA